VTRREGDRVVIDGPVTLKNVTGVLAESLAHVRAGASVIDLAEVSDLDSSLLAAMLSLIREAGLENRALALANLPAGLQTLAELYGVEEILTPSSP
jgi:phospholipid transport system transporter-binding protein